MDPGGDNKKGNKSKLKYVIRNISIPQYSTSSTQTPSSEKINSRRDLNRLFQLFPFFHPFGLKRLYVKCEGDLLRAIDNVLYLKRYCFHSKRINGQRQLNGTGLANLNLGIKENTQELFQMQTGDGASKEQQGQQQQQENKIIMDQFEGYRLHMPPYRELPLDLPDEDSEFLKLFADSLLGPLTEDMPSPSPSEGH